MKKSILSFGLLVSLFFCACSANSNPTESSKNEEKTDTIEASADTSVPFEEAKNYFVNNTYNDGDLTNPKITSQADFERFFGMATTMGNNGKPTSIDFSKQYVLAVIGQTTDKFTTLSVNSLKKINNEIVLDYKHTEGEKQSFTMRPMLLLIVDKQYEGEIKVIKN